jgi:hypothetical protein
MIPGSQNREDVTLAPPKASTALTSLVVFVVDRADRPAELGVSVGIPGGIGDARGRSFDLADA